MSGPEVDRLTHYLSALGLDAPEQVARLSSIWASLPALTGFSDLPPGPDDGGGAVPQPPPNLQALQRIGRGGMGEVWRAYDHRLHRVVALKALSVALAAHPDARARFVREAQATAQLAHPGVVPIHEVGELADGRPFFTMGVVEGRTLQAAVAEAHAAGPPLPRRMVEPVRRVAEALAWAHHRGVVHRDIKPANVMVGAFGQVLLLDWGLASKVREALDPVVVDGTWGPDSLGGSIVGTPGYMAPEQARGEPFDARADVWALGALLFFTLTGRDAFPARLLPGPPPALPPELPVDLAVLIGACLAEDPDDRPAHAGVVAATLVDWLDGAQARERALARVAEADALLPEQARLRQEAAQSRATADQLRREIEGSAPILRKRPLWDAEDAAHRAEVAADALQQRRLSLLEGALSHRPDLPEALDALAAHHRAAWRAAEAAGDGPVVAVHAAALARTDRGAHAAFRRGDGWLSLVTDPPGAQARLFSLVEQERRRVPVPFADLGPTPLIRRPLPMGSWLVELSAEGHETVRYPVFIPRQHDWSGCPPDAEDPLPIALPVRGSLGPDDCYLPAGWFRMGESRTSYTTHPPQWRWLGARVVRRFPVTVREHLAFLDDLAATGRLDEAWRFAPRERAPNPDAEGAANVTFDGRRFHRIPDSDGDLWDLDWPVFNVDWTSAMAHARWLAARTGQEWTLPDEVEWEKAARGVDGRAFSWGDHPEPTYACVREGAPGRPLPARVQDFPTDESPYGVRGMVGNVREWCREPFAPVGAPPPALVAPRDPTTERMLRGGSWFHSLTTAWTAGRFALGGTQRGDTVGFRLVRPYP